MGKVRGVETREVGKRESSDSAKALAALRSKLGTWLL
jgi:hypothetical protein